MAKKLQSDEARFLSYVQPEPITGCWLWFGRVDRDGYAAQFKIGSRTDGSRTQIRPHRFAYQRWQGAIPEGMVIDHLCRMRCCVNPLHLEVVTPLENHRRGLRAQRTHCAKGHAIEGVNAKLRDSRGGMRCRLCENAYQRQYQKANGYKYQKDYKERRRKSVREIG